MIQPWTQDLNQTLNSQKTAHSWPLKVSYGVSIVSDWEKTLCHTRPLTMYEASHSSQQEVSMFMFPQHLYPSPTWHMHTVHPPPDTCTLYCTSPTWHMHTVHPPPDTCTLYIPHLTHAHCTSPTWHMHTVHPPPDTCTLYHGWLSWDCLVPWLRGEHRSTADTHRLVENLTKLTANLLKCITIATCSALLYIISYHIGS